MEYEVIVYRRPNMFMVNDHPLNMVGVNYLKELFHGNRNSVKDKEIILFFPERFLNIIEEHMLIDRMEKYGCKKLTIYTHSVYIIQCSKNTMVVDDELIPEGTDGKTSNPTNLCLNGFQTL